MSNLENLYQEGKKNSPYLTLSDGESFTGQFVGVEKGMSSFGETNYYTFLVDGIEKSFNNKSFGFLSGMMKAGIKEGDTVKITRKGSDKATKYKIEKA